MAYLPCQNPDCRSNGIAHPNCHCYDHITGADRAEAEADGYEFPGTTKGMHLRGVRGGNAGRARAAGRSVKYMAKGGAVQYCSGPHKADCEHYAGGGQVAQLPAPINPEVTLGHAAMHHGLLGLLKDAGHTNMSDPDSHENLMGEARGHLTNGHHIKAADAIHGKSLAGGANRANLEHILERMGPSIAMAEPNPEALRGSLEYLNSAFKGHDALDGHIGKFLGKQKLSDALEPDINARKELNNKFDSFRENPDEMLDVAGKMGHYLPDHAATIGALVGTATKYFQSLKPKQPQMGPMDEPSPPDKSMSARYDRQLDIAQRPQLVLQHIHDGTLIPQDLTTIQTLFPALYRSMADKASAELIDMKTEKKEIPYRQRLGLSMLLGQPLDTTMTPQSMQAIMVSAGPQQAQAQKERMKTEGNATAVEMRAIEKTDKLSETPSDSRQINRASK